MAQPKQHKEKDFLCLTTKVRTLPVPISVIIVIIVFFLLLSVCKKMF